MMDSIARHEITVASGSERRCFFRYHAERLPEIDSSQFNPSGYSAAEPVAGAGGRGAAWFVASKAGPAVLKHYLRGGYMAHFSRAQYVYTGLARSRAMAEFELLARLNARGLPVPKPLAAFCMRGVISYRAALLTERIVGAHSFAHCVRTGAPPWTAVAQAIACFHRAGAEHADLNAENILLTAQGNVLVIDWDKGRLHEGPGAWCEGVLARLRRSLDKIERETNTGSMHNGWTELLAAYREAMR